jgi:hypothetical protein
MQLDEALQRGLGLGLLVGLVVGIGLLELGLLRQRRAGGAALEFLEQRDRLVVGARLQFILGFGIEPVGAPRADLVVRRRRTAGQQRCRSQQQGGDNR